jgi:hypothetical protein
MSTELPLTLRVGHSPVHLDRLGGLVVGFAGENMGVKFFPLRVAFLYLSFSKLNGRRPHHIMIAQVARNPAVDSRCT